MIKIKNQLIFSTALMLLSTLVLGQQTIYDLAVQNVNVFDSKTKNIQEHKTILINADTIVSIISSSQKVKAKKTIEGKID